jgi:mannose/cellobiose epimerase-like protein (N-acyl-D-glucosamine 2-epimerase family)
MAKNVKHDEHPDLAALRRALFDRALPLWRDRGWDERHGGFHDRLDVALDPVALPAKRLLVQCRQLFVFSNAAVIAPERGWADIAQRGYAFLTEHYWDARHGGWFFSVAPSGAPHDRRKDTYGQAFALFALAHYAKVFQSDAALALAEQTLDGLEQHVAAQNGGFHEATEDDWRIIAAVRRQNPHMHLLEAFLALYEVTGNARYRRAALDMMQLLGSVFVDPATATLGEFFDAEWQPDPVKGAVVEPGHHFEWYWLLHRAAKLFATAPLGLAERLFAWADRHGVDTVHGGVFDQLHRDGSIVADGKRLWPLTEAIRAYALRGREQGRSGDRRMAATLTAHLLRCYADERSGFREHLDRSGGVIVNEVFASSLYHVFGAYAELALLADGKA